MAESGIAPEILAKLEIWWPSGLLGSKDLLKIPIPALIFHIYVGLMAKGFTRKKENFKCTNCGMFVMGNGYTNHCPRCLWSMHVDINPGDRQNKCMGMMEPIGTLYDKTGFVIMHRCTECGEERNVFGAPNDNTELMTELSSTEQFMS